MFQTVTYQQFEIFQQQRNSLAALIKRHLKILHSLNMSQPESSIKRLEELVLSDSFKVLVLGEFKRGKSTLINALLGAKVLPAYARPCTAIINEVKWGETPRAVLHQRQSEDTTVSKTQEIPVDEIEKYVVIQEEETDNPSNPYDKVELFWPLELCRNGVEIIDSPGLNEHETRQQVTMDYLPTVDAVLFVLSCIELASQSEMQVIDDILLPSGHEDTFFVCNRINAIEEEEQKSIKRHGIKKLAPKTKLGAERVFFIDALGALKGRLKGESERLERSGLPLVEAELEKFLATERGKIKILRPATELQRSIYQAREVIPERERMLSTDLKTLEERYQAAQEPLRLLEAERKLIVGRISVFLKEMKQEIANEGCNFYRRLHDEKLVEEWVKNFKPKTSVNFISFEGTKPQVERLVKEVTAHLASKLESELLSWQRDQLQPLVSSRLEDFLKELNDGAASEFIDQVDNLKFQISGSTVSTDDVGPRKVSAMERVLAAAGGLLIGIGLGDFGLAGIGAVFGYQEMAKAIIPQLLIGAVTIVLSTANPLVFIPVLLSSGMIQGFLNAKSTNEKIKKEVGKRFVASMRDSAQQRGNEIADGILKNLGKLENSIDQGLGQEIQNIRDQANSILQEKQKGQANVEEKLSELQALRQDLDTIDSDLDSFIMQFALPHNENNTAKKLNSSYAGNGATELPIVVQASMVCTSCTHNNPANSNFCSKCGTPLVKTLG